MAADDHGKGNSPKPETGAEEALGLTRDPDARPEGAKPASGDGKTVVVEDQVSNQNIHYGSQDEPDARLGGAGARPPSDGVIVESGTPAETSDESVARSTGRTEDSIADSSVVPTSPALDGPEGGAGRQGVGSAATGGAAPLWNDGVQRDARPDSDVTDLTSSGAEYNGNVPRLRSLDGEDDSATATSTIDLADDPVISAEDVSGDEDTAVALNLSAVLNDTDGSETLSVTISGVPDGATLNHGTDLGGGEWSVDPADLADLTITPPAGSDADFTLTLNAASTDGTDTATVSRSFTITVDPVADEPVISVENVSGDEDTAISLDLSAALADTDGSETLAVTISGVPDGASFNRGSDLGGGEWSVDPADLADLTITPPAGSDADFTLTLNAASTDGTDTATVSRSFSVTVDPVNQIIGTKANNKINGTDGDDYIDGAGGNDTITGGGGDDRIVGGAGNDKLYGGEGDDTFEVGAGHGYDRFSGDGGNDRVVATGDNVAIGLDGHYTNGVETISAEGHSGVTVTGTNASQTLNVSNTTLDGIEAIDGAGGNDTITGGAGDDRIIGGAGKDKLYGGEGDDTFEVGAGHGYDRFSGDGGNDRVVATGDNVAIGLDGHYTNGVETISAEGHSGVTVTGTNASQTLDFSATTLDGIAAIDGAGGNDTITGSAGDDRIIGGAGKDKLYGGEGNDTFVFGLGDGKDTVDGGNGGSWSDVIQLEGVSTGPGGGDWTIRIDSGAIAEANADHLILTEDAAGTITLSDGSSVNFEGIERIEW
jgi:Ca2+-binding RTX toxin-like protein